jgi:hypothetical protein
LKFEAEREDSQEEPPIIPRLAYLTQQNHPSYEYNAGQASRNHADRSYVESVATTGKPFTRIGSCYDAYYKN